MLNLQGDVEHALRTPPMRPDGIQEELCEPPTHQVSYANRPSKRLAEQDGGFVPWSIHEGEIPLSEEKLQKIDSVLAQLALSIDSVKSIENAIAESQLIVPALSTQLARVKRLLNGDKRQLSHYKEKGKEEGSTLLCDSAMAEVDDANKQMLRVMHECSEVMIHSGATAGTPGFTPETISKLYNKLGV